MSYQSFEELPIWQESMQLTTQIYELTRSGEFAKDFALRDQLRRSIISVSSNIVEGFERRNNNELIRFLHIAKGSAGETRSQMHIAHNVGYVESSRFEELNDALQGLTKQIGGFISYLQEHKSRNS